MSASSYRLSPSVASLVFATALLALSSGAAAAAEGAAPAASADRGPSIWRDGAWLPIAAAPEPAEAARDAASAAFRNAAAAASEGSEIRLIFPLVELDGSAERAVFAPVIDGESCLWSTDGTVAGTFRVESAGGCVPVPPGPSIPFVGVADGVAYFLAGSFLTATGAPTARRPAPGR